MSDDEDWFARALEEEVDEDQEPGPDPADDASGSADDEPADETRSDPDGEEDAAASVTDAGDDLPAPGGESSPLSDEPGGDEPFQTDFASALRDAPGGDAGGSDFGGLGPAGDFGDAFDDAEFESDIDRIDLGIEGLDDMILGGVPERSLMVAIGGAGTGKTTFALQFLRQALLQDERAVFITLEETRDRILSTADDKGWDFSGHAAAGDLAVVDIDPVEMASSLASIRSELPELIEEFGATRLVLDSVSLLEMMYDRPADRRSEVFEFARSLKRAGITTVVTSESADDSPFRSKYGIIEYLADAVFVLQYVRPSDFRETRLAVEIQKIRDANHSRETKPYEITDDGIEVYRQANIF